MHFNIFSAVPIRIPLRCMLMKLGLSDFLPSRQIARLMNFLKFHFITSFRYSVHSVKIIIFLPESSFFASCLLSFGYMDNYYLIFFPFTSRRNVCPVFGYWTILNLYMYLFLFVLPIGFLWSYLLLTYVIPPYHSFRMTLCTR